MTASDPLDPTPTGSLPVIWTQDRDLRYTWVHTPTLGLDAADVLGRRDEDLLDADTAARLTALKRRVLETGAPIRETIRVVRGTRAEIHDLTLEPMRDAEGRVAGVAGVSTQLRQAAAAVAAPEAATATTPADATITDAEEARLLVAEAHHRVKNSLTMIGSLIRLERSRRSLPECSDLLADLEARINAVGALHDRLSRSGDAVPFASYLGDLCAHVAAGSAGGARLVVEAEPVTLPGGCALRLGMIASELVTNALKHGAAAGGTVTVRLRRDVGGVTLSVADGGEGAPDPPGAGAGLGLRIINALLASLDGTLEIERDADGVRTLVAVPLPAAAPDEQSPAGAAAS